MRQKHKDQDMLLSQKVKISAFSEFSILPYTHNRKLRNTGKFSFTSNFGISCNLRLKNEKKKNFHKNFKNTSAAKLFFVTI